MVALLAGLVIAGTVVRTESVGQSSQFGTFVGGLRSLGQSEALVIFEDGTTGAAAGWSAGAHNAEHVGLGAIWLVDPGSETLTRSIALPEGTVQATVRLDLIAIDDWALEGLELAINGQPILRHRFSSRPDMVEEQVTEVFGGDGIMVRTDLMAPRALGFAEGDAALDETRLVVDVAIVTPGDAVSLTVTPLPRLEATADTTAATVPRWAIDNLIVVAGRLP